MRIIIKNLPPSITEDTLTKTLSAIGPPTELTFPLDGKRNFCFVGYKTQEAANQAIKHFNRSYLKNYKLIVEKAEDDYMEKRRKLNTLLNQEDQNRKIKFIDSLTLEVLNIPEGTTKAELRDVFVNAKKIVIDDDKYILIFNDLQTAHEAQNFKIVFGRRVKYRPYVFEDKEIYYNSLFFNFSTIIDRICDEEKIKKEDLVDIKDSDLGARIAILETHLVEQTKRWLDENKIDVKGTKVDKKTLLIRNYDLLNNLDGLGKGKVKISPSKCLAVVEFVSEKDCLDAYKKFCMKRVKDKAIYCEFLPVKAEKKNDEKNTEALKNVKNEENKENNDNDEKNNKDCNDLRKSISKEKNNVSKKNNVKFDGKMKESITKNEEKQFLCKTNKIMIKNVPFQANVDEIKKIIESQVKIKDIRMPVKRDGGKRGFCFLELENEKDCEFVCDYFGKSTHLYGRRLIFMPADK